MRLYLFIEGNYKKKFKDSWLLAKREKHTIKKQQQKRITTGREKGGKKRIDFKCTETRTISLQK